LTLEKPAQGTKSALYYNTSRTLSMSSSITPVEGNYDVPQNLNRVSLGFNRLNNSNYINGHLKKFMYYGSPVTEDNLRTLTGNTRPTFRFGLEQIITDGLVLLLDAGNPQSYPGSGTTWTDLSGNGNNGTLVNGVGYSASNGGALVFDGVDDYVTLSNVLTNSGNLTYCAWVYRSVVSPDGYTNLFTSTTQNEQFQLDLTGYPGGFGVYLNGSFNSTDSNVIPLNTWVYICWQRNGTGLYGYLNGVEQFSATTGNTVGYGYNNSTAVSRINKIGAYSSVTSYNLNGKLGPVHMYNRALSATEITQNFNALRSRFGI
jgi:hypothetical protein